MNDEQIKLLIGSLLHESSKVFIDNKDIKTDEEMYKFFSEEIKLDDKNILEKITYYNDNNLDNLKKNSSTYIVHVAKKIALGTYSQSHEDRFSYNKETKLASIFNILNNNHQNFSYDNKIFDDKNINYPIEKNTKSSPNIYQNIKNNIKKALLKMEYSKDFLNYLLEVLEKNLIYIPSNTSKDSLLDISLYDYSKLIAAISSCIFQYKTSKNIYDLREKLYMKYNEFCNENVFLIYSMDVSGIQDFIYTIHTEKALKTLRARSFYLEIMMEHLVDELLDLLKLSRANILYTGGGHAYLILPNTLDVKKELDTFERRINKWFIDTFNISLYIAGGCGECSANSLRNYPKGSYSEIFKNISSDISLKKMRRYNSEQIIEMISQKTTQKERECKVCKRTDMLTENDKCEICENLQLISNEILKDEFFVIVNEKVNNSLPLPLGKYLVSKNKKEIANTIKYDKTYIRCYSKNKFHDDIFATKIWVGDYVQKGSFEELSNSATGINRIALLRADIDNLGQSFISGFENDKNKDLYVTISRTSVFSRKLSTFFKLYINNVIENGKYFLPGASKKQRDVVIVYSGGDDMFIVGAWDDIIGISVDIYESFKKYCQNTLTISAGIGVYHNNYPISSMAKEVGELEENSKSMDGKNSITIFDENNCYKWNDFIDNILNGKLKFIYENFENAKELSRSLLYKILEFLRNRDDIINLARFSYLMARLEDSMSNDNRENFEKTNRKFSKQMCKWIQNDKDSKELITAIYIYAYLTREEGK